MDSTTNESKELTGTLFATWVAHDSQSVIDALDTFPTEVGDMARATLIFDLINDSADAALAIYDEIENRSSKLAAARALAYSWSRTDGAAALNWVLTDPSTEAERTDLAVTVIRQMTQQDFLKAFELARDQPPLAVDNDEDIGLEATVINFLASQDLEEALRLLPSVREGPTKLRAYRHVGHSLVRHDRLNEAIAKGKALTEEDQTRYFTSIGYQVNVREDPESIFVMLDQLPSKIAQSRIATVSISNNQRSGVYDDQQVERLKEYLTNNDRRLLKIIEETGIGVPASYLGY